jgi:hypothetical protein
MDSSDDSITRDITKYNDKYNTRHEGLPTEFDVSPSRRFH